MSPADPAEHPLRVARDKLNLRLIDVAAAANVSAGLLSMCEHGYVPKPSTMTRIAAAVHCTVEAIWPE